jgi:CheY-like chemotaxis protein
LGVDSIIAYGEKLVLVAAMSKNSFLCAFHARRCQRIPPCLRSFGLLAGMDRYVSKPIRVSELFATLERLVPGERKRQTDEEVLEASDGSVHKIL